MTPSPDQPPLALRSIPSVDKVLRELGELDLPRPLVLAVVRRELDAIRANSRDNAGNAQVDVMQRIRAAIDDLRRSRLQNVVNGTGIIIHTNFGRSPLGPQIAKTLANAAAGYSNLEYDLTGGSRGLRGHYVERGLAILCGAEAATVVNNCAAALVLILRHFALRADRNEVIISRSELVQIGGGFRIPEILEASGVRLREIGTTNKTTLDDYARATGAKTAMILKVHRSNFYMEGFVESPSTAEIAHVAEEHGVVFVEDLGSGALFPTEALGGGEHEPTPAEVISQGADLVTFSGDKLVGGPQAGIIAGDAGRIESLKRDPFFRALRCDKLIFAALQSVVDLHLAGDQDELPIFAMMRIPADQLQQRAEGIAGALKDTAVRILIGQGKSQIGGGSLPRTTIPSVTLQLTSSNRRAEQLLAALRSQTLPVVGYIDHDRVTIDLRTVFPEQDALVISAIRNVSQSER